MAALLPFAVMVVLMLLALSVFALRIYAGVSAISGQDFRYPISARGWSAIWRGRADIVRATERV